jgi:hypothetical protein
MEYPPLQEASRQLALRPHALSTCCCAHWARISACAKTTVHYGDSADSNAKSEGLQLHLSTPAYLRLHRVSLIN